LLITPEFFMLTIRIAGPLDVKGIAFLSNQLGYPCSADAARQFLNDLNQDPGHAVLVADSDDHGLAGWVHVFITKRLFMDPFSEIGGLVVKDGLRGLGIGKSLLAAAEKWAFDQDCREIRVRSNIIRTDAHDFYLGQEYQDNKKQTVFIKSLKT
jgi:GNAT superfamily N-acetyltransferase